jgi:hypothetical protein
MFVGNVLALKATDVLAVQQEREALISCLCLLQLLSRPADDTPGGQFAQDGSQI